MLELGYFSSLVFIAQCRLLIVAFKKYMGRGLCSGNVLYYKLKSNDDYVIRLIKQVFHIILVFLDALRTPNYSLEQLLIKSCKIQTCLHKHHFYIYRTDFAMK